MEEVVAVGRVNGFDVSAFNRRKEKGYAVRLPGSQYEVTVMQEYGDGMWYGPTIFMSQWSTDPKADDRTPYPAEGRTSAIFLLGVVATVFTDMLLRPNEPCTLARFDPMYDGEDGLPRK